MAEQHDTPRRGLGVSGAQVAGSALAAMTAAVFASWAGTAGTLIGAALASVFATVGSAVYAASLRRSREAVRRTATRARAGVQARTITQGPVHYDQPDAAREKHQAENEEVENGSGLQIPWGRVAATAAAVLLVVVATVTVFEAVTGKPISSLLGRNDDRGTTVGHVLGNDPAPKPAPTRTPNETPRSSRPSPSETPSQAPTSSPTTPAQSPSPSEAPTPSGLPTPSANPGDGATPGNQGAPPPTSSASAH